MAKVSSYCKAYEVKEFRAFSRWQEDQSALRDDTAGHRSDAAYRELRDDDILYLQENFVVTDGIFIDEHIVFSDISEEWKSFCQVVLRFRVPDQA